MKGVFELPFESIWVIIAVLAIVCIITLTLFFFGKLSFNIVFR